MSKKTKERNGIDPCRREEKRNRGGGEIEEEEEEGDERKNIFLKKRKKKRKKRENVRQRKTKERIGIETLLGKKEKTIK